MPDCRADVEADCLNEQLAQPAGHESFEVINKYINALYIIRCIINHCLASAYAHEGAVRNLFL